MTDTHFPWEEGQPTRPDVDALLKAFLPESLVVHWAVTDAQIGAVIGRSDGARFRTVCDAWVRRLLRDYGINMYRQKKVGYCVPTPEQVFARAHPRLTHIGRTAKQHIKEIAAVQAITAEQAATRDHQGRLMHQVSRESKRHRMNILPSAVPEQPRILPPKTKAGA